MKLAVVSYAGCSDTIALASVGTSDLAELGDLVGVASAATRDVASERLEAHVDEALLDARAGRRRPFPVVPDERQDPRRDHLVAPSSDRVGYPVARIDGIVVLQPPRAESVRRRDVLHERATAARIAVPPPTESRADLERRRKIEAGRDHQSVPHPVEAAVENQRSHAFTRAERSCDRRQIGHLARLHA